MINLAFAAGCGTYPAGNSNLADSSSTTSSAPSTHNTNNGFVRSTYSNSVVPANASNNTTGNIIYTTPASGSTDSTMNGTGQTNSNGSATTGTSTTTAAASTPTPTPAATPSSNPTTTTGTSNQNNGLNSIINSIVSWFGGSTSSGSTSGSNTSTTSGGSVPSGDTLAAIRQACVDEINKYRATLGRSPLTLANDSSANNCIDGQAAGDGSASRAHANFGHCGETAQDECPGWPGDPGASQQECLKEMWAEGPGGGHYENMSNSNYTRVSCGLAQVGGGWWLTQDFF